MKRMKMIGLCVSLVAVAIVAVVAIATPESKYDETVAGAAVNFAPNRNESSLLAIQVDSADPTAVVEFYGKSQRATPTALPTNGALVVFVSNSANEFTTNDLVVFFHAALDTVDYRTVSANTASNVTLSSGISAAGAAGDQLYELEQKGEIALGAASLNLAAGAADAPLFVMGDDSPFRILVNGTGSVVTATVSDQNL